MENLLHNSRKQGERDVEEAAFRRLVQLGIEAEPGSVEHDIWKTIHAFERVLKDERGRTVRLSRTRQKIARVGVLRTLRDWADDSAETEGFRMLLERDMLDLVGEAIVLRHPQHFPRASVDGAPARLAAHAADDQLLWPCGRTYACEGEA